MQGAHSLGHPHRQLAHGVQLCNLSKRHFIINISGGGSRFNFFTIFWRRDLLRLVLATAPNQSRNGINHFFNRIKFFCGHTRNTSYFNNEFTKRFQPRTVTIYFLLKSTEPPK